MDSFRAGIVLAALGALLLGIAGLGRWTELGRYESIPPRTWERFDPGLAARTPDLASLYRAAQSRTPRPLRGMPGGDAMRILSETVEDRFTHGDRTRYTMFGNWILRGLGAAVPYLGDIQDPDDLLRWGHSALCGDVSYVLMRMAGLAGIRTRHVLLNGHIVMEAWYDNGWHMYDPDIEVEALDDAGAVAGVAELARRPDLVRRAYSVRGDSSLTETVAALYADVGDNAYLAYPENPGFATPKQRPGRIQRAAHVAVFLLPALLVAAGGALAAGGGRRRRGGP